MTPRASEPVQEVLTTVTVGVDSDRGGPSPLKEHTQSERTQEDYRADKVTPTGCGFGGYLGDERDTKGCLERERVDVSQSRGRNTRDMVSCRVRETFKVEKREEWETSGLHRGAGSVHSCAPPETRRTTWATSQTG